MIGPSPAMISQRYVDRIDDPELDLKAKEYIAIVFEERDIPCFVGLALVSERLLREAHSLEEVPVMDEVPRTDVLIDHYNQIDRFDDIENSLLKHIERELHPIEADVKAIEFNDEVRIYSASRRWACEVEI
ncbi:hypothetical protein [Natrarchaeobaculum aegyptiacum]|uniref:Uncharacterized protein n=1 Tax=Natrarchaeobaculum aegyptiacum TaxID=745377 RepID=A0A2Z2HU60_9EURY|nr:hypothetical protein [Natrarchaeobaculum aegyptiacum]ARS90796.1 hypothetical protein B1756_14410 [Natrarchaeobaculum aegyptiacum]